MPIDLLADAGTISQFFLNTCLGLAIIMLIWDTVEVGRNDGANLVNAVFGARILKRETAVWVAGVGVVLGAYLSSDVIETARKGIFNPLALEQIANPLAAAFSVYIAVYIVDTILLYGYSAFGMPVSTTACLVFELLGASCALGLIGGFEIVYWGKAYTVIKAIIISIIMSGVAGFFIQRIVRGAIRDKCQDFTTLLMHGGWAAGGMLAGLTIFMFMKGMKNVKPVQRFFKDEFIAFVDPLAPGYGALIALVVIWIFYSVVIHVVLLITQERGAKLLFPTLAVIGMISMGFAFGQNDLANCASPGLASWNLYWHGNIAEATNVKVDQWLLLGCGVLLLFGMTTKNAQRVTRSQVHTGSMSNDVALYAPIWCMKIARIFIRIWPKQPTMAPLPETTEEGKQVHFDALRACVILTVSASVIATASSLGYPVSTTYVAFAAVIATGGADRILQRGDADLKLARFIWVVFSWFAAAGIAAVAAGLVCLALYKLSIFGMLLTVGVNIALRFVIKKRADRQEARVRQASRERHHPEFFTEHEG